MRTPIAIRMSGQNRQIQSKCKAPISSSRNNTPNPIRTTAPLARASVADPRQAREVYWLDGGNNPGTSCWRYHIAATPAFARFGGGAEQNQLLKPNGSGAGSPCYLPRSLVSLDRHVDENAAIAIRTPVDVVLIQIRVAKIST